MPRKTEDKFYITIQLKGDEIANFERFKEDQFLRSDAETARKLMLERLSQIYGAKTKERAA